LECRFDRLRLVLQPPEFVPEFVEDEFVEDEFVEDGRMGSGGLRLGSVVI
jgi:hypothetical protein